MTGKWYQSRTNQGAMIGGACLIIAATIGYLATRPRSPYPLFEVKTLAGGSEQVLSRLRLTPQEAVVDSLNFEQLSYQDLLLNDTLGVAIAKPETYEWTAGDLGKLESLTESDVPFISFFTDMAIRSFQVDTSKSNIVYFGIKLDHPTKVTLTKESILSGTDVGENPFHSPEYLLGWMRLSFEIDPSIPADSVQEFGRQLVQTFDSVIDARLPITRSLSSGVFVSKLTPNNFPVLKLMPWIKRDLIDLTLQKVNYSNDWPTLVVVDRKNGSLLFNETVRLEKVRIADTTARELLVNRVGFGIKHDESVFVVILQYLSTDPPEILPVLEKAFRSVRLRGRSSNK